MKKTILSTAILMATTFASTTQSFAADLNVNGFASVRAGQMLDVDGANRSIINNQI